MVTASSRGRPAALLDEWRALDARHAAVREALEHALQREHGVSLSEFEVLERLVEADQRKRRMQDLAEEIHLSQSALSRLAGRLESHGLVQRTMCDHDRRGIWACLTDKGEELCRRAAATHVRVLQEKLGGA
jgi:DNA-binding MarR family transcriptional regulator